MRPRGKPPTPSARSTAIEPVEMTSIFSSAAAPSFMIEPFPNCFSICRIAWSIARVFSDTATSHLLIAPQKERRRLASHRRHHFWPRGPGAEPPTSPALFFLAFGLHDLEGHRLDRLRDGLLAQLLLELFLRLLFGFLVLGLASTRRHRSLPCTPLEARGAGRA